MAAKCVFCGLTIRPDQRSTAVAVKRGFRHDCCDKPARPHCTSVLDKPLTPEQADELKHNITRHTSTVADIHKHINAMTLRDYE